MCACMALSRVWHSENNLQESTFSFHPVSPRDQTQVTQLLASAFTHDPLPQSGGSNDDKDHHVLRMP